MTRTLLRILHALAFVLPFATFTYLLLVPVPPQPKVPEPWMSFVINKATHAAGFGYLTVVGYTFFRRKKWQWYSVAFMVLHAVGTEIGQSFTGRYGCVRDVLIDWAGVAVGVAVARPVVRFLGRENPALPTPSGFRTAVPGPE